jgi:hypothetical protein
MHTAKIVWQPLAAFIDEVRLPHALSDGVFMGEGRSLLHLRGRWWLPEPKPER